MENRGIFSSSIIILATVVIVVLTTYFCLDMFEIIHVPTKYSLVDYLSSKIKVTQVAESEENKPDTTDSDRKVQVVKDERTRTDAELISPFEFQQTTGEITEVEEPPVQTDPEPPIVEEQQQTQGSTSYFTNKYIKDENKFYYNQLDIYGKLIYEELYKHVDDIKTGLYTVDFGVTFNSLLHEDNGAETLENAFQLSVNALVFDKPEIFFLDITKMYLFTEITKFGPKSTYRVSIGPSNGQSYLAYPFSTSQDVDNAKYRIDEIVNTVLSEIGGYSSYDKIRGVHDYIVENCEYDSTVSQYNIYNMYGTFINSSAVCEGYSKAFKYVMDKLDIPCIIACGTGVNQSGETESHAWNYVNLDGSWYGVDCTWDDPIIIGYGNATKKMRYHYFLVGSNDLFQDHQEDGNLVGDYKFSYPAISIANYK